jgi:hypothetical protein
MTVLSFSSPKVQNFFWLLTPYQFNQLLYFPNYLKIKPSSNIIKKDIALKILKKNMNRNYLDIEYWNYKFFIENLDRKNQQELEKTFYKTFVLSKNNSKKNSDLIYYFTNNYSNFSNQYKTKIIKAIFIKN